MGRMSDYDRLCQNAECQIMTFGRSRRFGQAHRTSAERSAECCVLGWNNVFYWWAHWAARKCRS